MNYPNEKTRKVRVSEYGGEPGYEGKFLGWGIDFVQFDMGGASYTCGIIEKGNGSVDLVPHHFIEFLD